jgi:hypothetical protein
MLDTLELELLATEGTDLLTCPLCESPFQQAPGGGILWAGAQPIGCLCERCLMTGPHTAALKARERACSLWRIVENAKQEFAGPQWLVATQTIWQHAVEWESLADQLRQEIWWRIKRQPGSEPLQSAKSLSG